MTAALVLADQGYGAHLVEKEGELGGNLRRLHYSLERGDVQQFLADLVKRTQSHPKITVHLKSVPVRIAGHSLPAAAGAVAWPCIAQCRARPPNSG